MLQQLGPDLWTIRHPDAGVGGLGTRTTLARLPDGGLWLHSPGDLSAYRAEIDALGPVRALVAPNKIHHLYVRAAHQMWPEARVYLAPGLREKVPSLPSGEVLGTEGPERPPVFELRGREKPEAGASRTTAPAEGGRITGGKAGAIQVEGPWSPTIEHLRCGGVPMIDELVFLHRPSRTLMLTDLAFNIRPPAPWHTRLLMTFNGGFDRFGPTQAFRWLILKDRAALRRSLDDILAWDFDRVTVTHGDVVETGGHAAFADAFRWV